MRGQNALRKTGDKEAEDRVWGLNSNYKKAKFVLPTFAAIFAAV